MTPKIKKIWNMMTQFLIAVVVILAILLAGVRLGGLQVYTVLSGSMEPAYPVGSLLYVKKIDPLAVMPGQPITFLLDENTVATHRVVEIISENDAAYSKDGSEAGNIDEIFYRTKGDANKSPDGEPVSSRNLIGVPVFSIPWLGYFADFIQNPPGKYFAYATAAVLLLFALLPDFFGEKEERQNEGNAEKLPINQ